MFACGFDRSQSFDFFINTPVIILSEHFYLKYSGNVAYSKREDSESEPPVQVSQECVAYSYEQGLSEVLPEYSMLRGAKSMGVTNVSKS